VARRAVYRVGCSGWQYRHWGGDFYPLGLPQRQWLEYYSRHFDTVEINNSFYRLPDESVFTQWRARVPGRFVFAVKASRFLTHMKKLKDPDGPVEHLFSRARELRTKLGPVLYQLPRQMVKNVDRLQRFLAALPDPARIKHAIEFRDPSWYDEDVFRALRERNVALCLHDMAGSTSPRMMTAKFVYVRFHGASGTYSGGYSKDNLASWADWLAGNRASAFVYFNNDIGGHAPRDAKQLREMLDERTRVSGLAAPESTPDELTHPTGDRPRRPAARTRASGSQSRDRRRSAPASSPGGSANPRSQP
jgi:uncharacterized protein YecE (DUF72 family)